MKYSTWPRSTPPFLLCTQFIHGKEEDKTPIYIHVCARACDYITKKYKRKMCYHQKNNSNVKTFERLKYIKES